MTATLTEAEVIKTGETVLARLDADDFPWPSDTRACLSITAARDALEADLGGYSDVRNDRIHPGFMFPELEHDDDAYNVALRMLADDVLAWARAAVLVVAEHVGHEAAEALKAAEVTL